MMPSILYEALADDAGLANLGLKKRIYEDTSADERPTSDGVFIVVSFMETVLTSKAPLGKGPRNVIVAVHQPWHLGRSYDKINKIIERVTEIYESIVQQSGKDEIRVTEISLTGKSRQFSDPGWQTLTRTATYGVLYQESAA